MIQIQNLKFNYRRKPQLFRDLHLTLEQGKIYGLLGKNGTGKSTLLKLIQGALFSREGALNVKGSSASERRPGILSDIYFLTEDYELPSVRIKDYVSAYRPFYPRFDSARFDELVEIFEVPKGVRLNEISFGQKKKVLISFALATGCQYLIMDEPTNGLDIPSKKQFRKAMLGGFKEDQVVIISTHQIRDLNQLLESVIIIDQGKILFHKTVSEMEEKLNFEMDHTEHLDGSLYSERVAGGYLHLMPNAAGTPSEIDLEVLFNAVIEDQDKITAHF